MTPRTIYHTDKEKIVALFVGKSVSKIDDDKLYLNDGTLLQIVPNTGGCSCGAGDYELTELNSCENIITNVEVVDSYPETTDYSETHTYEVFVYAENRKINLLTVQGDDGNGYYGTGFWITVSDALTP